MILIVEDDTSYGMSLERLLRFAGHEAVFCPGGSEALTLIHIRRPQLIILDLKMPVMDGLTLLRSIRNDESFKSIPILVYTSDFTTATRNEAVKAGAQEVLVKGTVAWEALLRQVESFVGEKTWKLS